MTLNELALFVCGIVWGAFIVSPLLGLLDKYHRKLKERRKSEQV